MTKFHYERCFPCYARSNHQVGKNNLGKPQTRNDEKQLSKNLRFHRRANESLFLAEFRAYGYYVYRNLKNQDNAFGNLQRQVADFYLVITCVGRAYNILIGG